ncbi:SDR family oxidoreductase [Salinisphaera sp. T31B1]|uniref:SDR family oxidoreductase n=1 Tax=Salinisphaera sp. T31B1 TaxID=727963 RepID=UPI003340AB65
MSLEPSSRTAIVTGAGQGIGRAITGRLLADGYHVHALDIDRDALDDLYERARGKSAQLTVRTVDVADEPGVAEAVKALDEAHGRLDVLVNNAGLADPFNGPIESLALSDWERVIRVNLTGYFLLSKHATPLLRRSGGCIVNMASTRMLQSEAHTEAYAASKGGINALTHALSISLGPDIRVNGIAPGWIDVRDQRKHAEPPSPLRDMDHAQHPAGRVGRGEDIAAAVAFLCSAEAAFITGQTLVIDGGMTRRMIYQH